GPGCKGRRDYAWAWAATASPRHWLLIRRSPADPADLAFYYCHVPQGRPATLTGLVTVTGKRWPAEMVFTPLAKRAVRPLGRGREGVGDLDVAVGDDHAVDEQLGELPAVVEGGGGQPGLDGLAEALDPIRDSREFQPLVGDRVQLALLGQ